MVVELQSSDSRWRTLVRKRPDGLFQVHLEKWVDDPRELAWVEIASAVSITDTLDNARALASELLGRHARA